MAPTTRPTAASCLVYNGRGYLRTRGVHSITSCQLPRALLRCVVCHNPQAILNSINISQRSLDACFDCPFGSSHWSDWH